MAGELRTHLTGTKYPNADGSSRKDNINHCIPEEPLQLRHTPIKQDKNAVRVFRQNGEELGWIPKEYAQEIAFHLDAGAEVKAVFEKTFQRYANAPLTAVVIVTRPGDTPKGLTKTCGHCGEQVGSETTKCPACRKSICKNCGNPIGTGVTKCPKCGESTTMGGIQSIGCLFFGIGIFLILIVVFFSMC